MLASRSNGLRFYSFESFPADRVLHGVFTRLGGVSEGPFSSLNLSLSVPDKPEAVDENRRRFYAAIGADASRAVRTVQVHGSRIAAVGPDDVSRVQKATDGLITTEPALPLVMAFADCTPVMLYDPVCGAIGMAHAGWRGTVGGVCQAAVKAMTEAFGTRPSDVLAAIGPAIGPCCYEVGPEVEEAVERAFKCPDVLLRKRAGEKPHFDQWTANEVALRQAGVRHVERSDICTACRVDEFYSHRAELGRTGRFGALIMLRSS